MFRLLPFSSRDVLDTGRSLELASIFPKCSEDWTNRRILDLIISEFYRPALASIRSISQTFSLERWWFIRCELMSALQLFKHTKSTHPRLIPHFPPVIAEKEQDAAILSAKVIPAKCKYALRFVANLHTKLN